MLYKVFIYPTIPIKSISVPLKITSKSLTEFQKLLLITKEIPVVLITCLYPEVREDLHGKRLPDAPLLTGY
jgi:hypothetical protein